MSMLDRHLAEKISIKEYYMKYIAPITEYAVKKDGTRFLKGYSDGFNGKGLAICPLHPDRDPSLGIIKSKEGVELFHCLGCGATGKVTRLHQRIINLRKIDIGLEDGINITYEEAGKRLARDLGINTEDIQEPRIDYNNHYIKQQIALRKSMEKYSIRSLENDILGLRLGEYTTHNKRLLLNRYLVSYMEDNT